jgi:hypothetical protein
VKRTEVYYIYAYEDSIMKPTILCMKKKGGGEWEYKGSGELVQGILYACVKLSQ